MKIEYTLHKGREGFVITSNEVIERNDKYLSLKSCLIYDHDYDDSKSLTNTDFKVIAQQDEIDFSGLSEEQHKEIGWFDVVKMAMTSTDQEMPDINDESTLHEIDQWNGHWTGFQKGFQKAQEVLFDENKLNSVINKFKDFIEELPVDWMGTGDWKSAEREKKDWDNRFNQFVQSLSQQSWKVELETKWVKDFVQQEGFSGGAGTIDIQQLKLTNGKIKILNII